MKIALMGQPNSGKSTIFNHVAGYKAVTSNFPGKTVEYTSSKVNLFGEIFEIVDLPGTYSLTSFDLAELEARKYLLRNNVDVIINVIDSSLLSRSLELTLQLLELKLPMVICLNMIDEAERKGIEIDVEKLSKILGVPVMPAIALKGRGVKELFSMAYKIGEEKGIGKTINFSKDVEEVIAQLSTQIKKKQINQEFNIPERFLALKYLENDSYFMENYEEKSNNLFKKIVHFQNILEETHGRQSDVVISSERHHLSMNIYESVVSLTKPHAGLIDYLDNILMHPFLGYISLGLIFYLFFNLIFSVGKIVEEPLLLDISFGEWEGKKGKDVFTEELQKQWKTNPNDVLIPGGETFYQVLDRLHRLFLRLRKQTEKTIALVTHGAVINLIFVYLTETHPSHYWDFYVKPCSISHIKLYENGKISLVKFNDDQHLTE